MSRPLSSRGELEDTRARLSWISAKLDVNISDEVLGTIAKTIDAVWSDHVRVYDDTLKSLHRLRGFGLKLGVLSNGPNGMRVLKTALKIEYLLDAFIISCEIGCSKPQPEAYRKILDRLGIAPCKTLFVGDGNDKELEGAQNAGLYAIRIRRDAVGDLHDVSEKCDFEVASLAELSDWVERHLSGNLATS